MSWMGEVRLENTTPPHRKFYHISVTYRMGSWDVVYHWGRMSLEAYRYREGDISSHHANTMTFNVREEMIKEVRKTIATRTKHGYHVVGTPSLSFGGEQNPGVRCGDCAFFIRSHDPLGIGQCQRQYRPRNWMGPWVALPSEDTVSICPHFKRNE
jgi:predicted DNA-binding WGR domain protein